MQTITGNYHVREDGILHLNIPVDITNADLTITVIVKPVNNDEMRSP